MPEKVSISVNGQSRVPPGFRFHPTEEELLQYYLRKKVAFEKIDLDVIVEVDLNKLEPWDIQERCKIGSTPQNDWYFFSHKDKKYPTGTRTNRATMTGFWKATGRDKIIYGNGRRIGMRKTLVFYKGRAPRGQKSDWIMHEYRLDDNGTSINIPSNIPPMPLGGETAQEEGWVVCRIFKKKNLNKSPGQGSNGLLTSSTMVNASELTESLYQPSMLSPSCSSEEGSLEQIFLHQMGGKLPSLESPVRNYHCTLASSEMASNEEGPGCYADNPEVAAGGVGGGGPSDWAAMDRMLAAHLNGDDHDRLQALGRSPPLSSSSVSGYYVQLAAQDHYSSAGEIDLWSLINRSLSSTSTSDPLM